MTRLLPQTCLQWTLLVGACLAAGLLRIPGLAAELNHDEAFTWLSFASQSYSHIVTDYSLPNNHIFHSVLVRLSAQVFGSAEWVLRLPAFIGGWLTVPAFYLLGRAFAGRVETGLVAAWILTFLPVHIHYAQMARGYTLLVLGSALTLLAVHQVLQNRCRWWWGLFIPCGFLTGYTVPSGGLHLLALGVWTLMVLRRDLRQLCEALAAHALVGVLLIVGYWPLRHAFPAAVAKWGITVDSDPTILIRLIGEIARLLGGNPWPLLVILVALLGFSRFVYSRHLALPYIAGVWILPIIVALFVGSAGPPRTYLFLLPAFVLCLVVAFKGRYRVISSLALLILWTTAYRLPATAEAGYAATADYLRRDNAQSRVVIAPFIMGIPLWHYAQEPIANGLARAMSTHQVDELLVATHVTDARFVLGRFLTSGNINYDSRYMEFSGDSFAQAHQVGHVVLNRFSGRGQRVFPPKLVQEWKQSGTAVDLGAGPTAFSHWPSMELTHPEAEPFALHSGERFSSPDSGLVVLSYALSDPDTRITLYFVDRGKVVPIEMSRTVETAQYADPEGGTWFLESHFAPVQPETYYGVYIRGSAVEKQYVADLFCTFFKY